MTLRVTVEMSGPPSLRYTLKLSDALIAINASRCYNFPAQGDNYAYYPTFLCRMLEKFFEKIVQIFDGKCKNRAYLASAAEKES